MDPLDGPAGNGVRAPGVPEDVELLVTPTKAGVVRALRLLPLSMCRLVLMVLVLQACSGWWGG